MLDTPQGVTDLNRVAHGILILEDDVKPGDDVTHQILRSEANREARESRDRGDRRNIDAEFLNRSDQGHGPDYFIAGAVDIPRERPGLLLAGLRRASWRRGGSDDQVGDEMQEPIQKDRDEKDADEVEQIGNGEIGQIGWEARHK